MKKVKKGMTILEVIVAMGIIGIMLIPLANGLLTSVKINKKGEETQEAKLMGQQAIETLKIQNTINGNTDIPFYSNEKLSIQGGTIIPGTTDIEYGIKSVGDVNGYELNGKIKEENVISINEDSYENSGIEKQIGLYINIDRNEDGKIILSFVENPTGTKDIKALMSECNSAAKTVINSSVLNLDINISENNINLIVDGEVGFVQPVSKLNGVVLIYISDVISINEGTGASIIKKPTIDIDIMNTTGIIKEVQILRDIKVSKENYDEGLNIKFGEDINRYQNIIYDSTNSKKGLYTVNLDISKKGEVVESTTSQFYLER
ncbi:type II secretion system protein [uncultured Clostridium sp.]|jgi:prepilin-type N-terminal cleavage/methylation domain-containing protein|uniref:type II secretion system protein n=1 Tax=uncultured Clostridium sp. TaxID=59620 RepID=UPI00262685CC|nr:type II secretion system protein [uncultured Clostridium sp.]